MKDINSALRSQRKLDRTEFYQLIVIVNFNRVIAYLRLIENRLIVNIPRRIYNNNNNNNNNDRKKKMK